MSKNVLVTGIGGFAGTWLTPELSGAGYRIHGIVNRHGFEGTDLDSVQVADLRDLDALRAVVRAVKPSHVVHLAAISFVGHDDAGEIYATNVVGTRNLLQALSELDTPPEAALLTSSANIYGNSDKGVLSESEPANPANDYAVSKIAMEYMARQFLGRLNIVIARPFNYTGVGQAANFLVPKIVNHFRDRAPIIELGNIDVSRDFSDVRTVVRYLRALLETQKAAGQVYNLCTGKPYSLETIIETCRRLSGHDLEVRVNPAFVRANEVKILVGDPAKLHAEVGNFPEYSLEETLDWMLKA